MNKQSSKVKPIKYLLQRYPYHYDILNDDADYVAGQVYLLQATLHRVCDDQGHDLFSVRRIENAIPRFARYYRQNPPGWRPAYPRGGPYDVLSKFLKRTHFGELSVYRDDEGLWIADRGDLPLMRGASIARFNTSEEARAAADTHVRDYYPNSASIEDGLCWVDDGYCDWRLNIERVLERKKRAA